MAKKYPRTLMRRMPLVAFVGERPHVDEYVARAPALWRQFHEEGMAYLRWRLKEIHRLTGSCSAGVASVVRIEAEALSDAAFLRGVALGGDQPMVGLLEKAHQLNSVAMRASSAAWTLAQSERQGRKKPGTVPPSTQAKSLADELEED